VDIRPSNCDVCYAPEGHKGTHALQYDRLDFISERKKKDRLAAAVSPKSNQVFSSGRCECSALMLPAPAEQSHHAEAGDE
jgi:hypothetical protein